MSTLQDVPVCLVCAEKVRASDAVFEAPCGHEDCPSAVYHGLCLMEWRDKGRDNQRAFVRYMQELLARLQAFGHVSVEELNGIDLNDEDGR